MEKEGKELLRIFHGFRSRTSILDDFSFYDKRQELMEARMQAAAQQQRWDGPMGRPLNLFLRPLRGRKSALRKLAKISSAAARP